MLKFFTLIATLAVALGWPLVAAANTLTFGVTPQRTGWDPSETLLTPANIANVVHRWDSPLFAPATIGLASYPAHVYGAPLELDGVRISAGPYAGHVLSLILAGTTSGDVYAVNAFAQTGVAAGAIVWHRRLAPPELFSMDNGMPLGIEGTGVIDSIRGRWYVADRIAGIGWAAFAINVFDGTVVPGWPVLLSANIAAFDTNGNPGWKVDRKHSVRGALNLSLDGSKLYVPFGTFGDTATGWLVAIDTARALVQSAFSISNVPALPGGGLWSSGGATVGLNGNVYVTSGNVTTADVGLTGVWGESLLAFSQLGPLALAASYTPWNLTSLEADDADLGAGSVLLAPDLSATGTTTPHLAVFLGKQGVAYLLDIDHLTGGAVARTPAASAQLDASLKAPGALGPLSVFGPYCDFCDENADNARARSTPAYFSLGAASYVFVTGTPKLAIGSSTTVPPCLVRLRLLTPALAPAYLIFDGANLSVACLSPGSPIVVGQANPLVWIYDANVTRHQPLTGSQPILRVFDPRTMREMWTSGTALDPGGKFTLPLISHGNTFVATDRIQAFGL